MSVWSYMNKTQYNNTVTYMQFSSRISDNCHTFSSGGNITALDQETSLSTAEHISKPQTKPSALLVQPHTPIFRPWLQFNNVNCSHKMRFMVIILTGHVAARAYKKMLEGAFAIEYTKEFFACSLSEYILRLM